MASARRIDEFALSAFTICWLTLAGAEVILHTMFAAFFDISLAQNVFCSFLEALLFAALFAVVWRKYVESPEKEADHVHRCIRLIEQLIDVLEKNHQLSGIVVDQLRRGACPTFNVDLTILDATASLKFELLDDYECCAKVDHTRFELAHLHRKVDLLLTLATHPSSLILRSGTEVGRQEHESTFFNLADSVLNQIEGDEESKYTGVFVSIRDTQASLGTLKSKLSTHSHSR